MQICNFSLVQIFLRCVCYYLEGEIDGKYFPFAFSKVLLWRNVMKVNSVIFNMILNFSEEIYMKFYMITSSSVNHQHIDFMRNSISTAQLLDQLMWKIWISWNVKFYLILTIFQNGKSFEFKQYMENKLKLTQESLQNGLWKINFHIFYFSSIRIIQHFSFNSISFQNKFSIKIFSRWNFLHLLMQIFETLLQIPG